MLEQYVMLIPTYLISPIMCKIRFDIITACLKDSHSNRSISYRTNYDMSIDNTTNFAFISSIIPYLCI